MGTVDREEIAVVGGEKFHCGKAGRVAIGGSLVMTGSVEVDSTQAVWKTVVGRESRAQSVDVGGTFVAGGGLCPWPQMSVERCHRGSTSCAEMDVGGKVKVAGGPRHTVGPAYGHRVRLEERARMRRVYGDRSYLERGATIW